MSGNDRVCGVAYLLKADSLALCCRKYSYISSLDKSAKAWFPSFCQNFERIYFLLVMMILGQYFLDKMYFLYLKVHLLIIFLFQNKLNFFPLSFSSEAPLF